jgi:glucose/arabinose dehydrogenase
MVHRSMILVATLTAAAANAATADEPTLAAIQITSGLNGPVGLAFAPGEPEHAFVIERTGTVVVLDLASGTQHETPFLDIAVSSGGTRGLRNLCFDPDYATNGFFYVFYNQQATQAVIIARFSVSADPYLADPESEVVMKTIPHPDLGHNGGGMCFGPDGHLYIGSGDGSPPDDSDPENAAQRLDSLLGKILRLDVDTPPDYIPPTNPYVDADDAYDEIWASGLRQPWRMSFDRETGDLYTADVGLATREEVNFQPAASPGGENYGWRCMEGTLCTGFEGCRCGDATLTMPVAEIDHEMPTGPCSVIGGHVYRGSAFPSLVGKYLYADYCGNFVQSFRVTPDGGGGFAAVEHTDHTAALNPCTGFSSISSFAEDPDGELYVVSNDGIVWKIAPALPGDADCDGLVDVADLVLVVLNWGPCPSPPEICPGDLNDDGSVGVTDLVEVIINWSE